MSKLFLYQLVSSLAEKTENIFLPISWYHHSWRKQKIYFFLSAGIITRRENRKSISSYRLVSSLVEKTENIFLPISWYHHSQRKHKIYFVLSAGVITLRENRKSISSYRLVSSPADERGRLFLLYFIQISVIGNGIKGTILLYQISKTFTFTF